MKQERKISTYRNYFMDFISTLSEGALKKIFYSLDMLKTQDRVSEKFVKAIRGGVYELRAEYEGSIYRVFFCFDEGNIVILFNGFQKKSQKTPKTEIKQAIRLKKEYDESRRKLTDKR
jgi:putative addiction module killer protein